MAKEKGEKTNLYLLSIVAIVAIVGIVVLILNSGGESISLSENDLTGEAIVKKPNNCGSGETPCGRICCDSMSETCGDGKCHPNDDDDDDDEDDDEDDDDGVSILSKKY